jgi:hypothetical protein
MRVFAEEADQALKNGEYTFRVHGDATGKIVLGVLAPMSPDQNGARDSLLVVDKLSLDKRGFRSASNQVDHLFKIRASGGSLTLSPKPNSYTVCKDAGATAGSDVVEVIQKSNDARSVWLTSIMPTAATLGALATLKDPDASESAVASAYGDLQTEVALGSNSALFIPRANPSNLSGVYAATSTGVTWDNCRPGKADPTVLTCSEGEKVGLDELLPRPKRFNIFGIEPQRYLRLRLVSVPSAADIYFGAVRHGSETNTDLDVRADDVPNLRLEKAGYEPCAYGERWSAKIIQGVRQILEATCTLRKKRRRSR